MTEVCLHSRIIDEILIAKKEGKTPPFFIAYIENVGKLSLFDNAFV